MCLEEKKRKREENRRRKGQNVSRFFKVHQENSSQKKIEKGDKKW